MPLGKKFPRGFLPSLLCLVAMLVVACGGNSSTGPGQSTPSTSSKAPANQQIAILPLSGLSDIATFDPGLSTDAYSNAANRPAGRLPPIDARWCDLEVHPASQLEV